MAARAMWKGIITFSDVELPVKMYAALEDRNIHFRLLHEPSKTPVKQRMLNPKNGNEVEYSEARRGVEVDRGTFVLLSEEEQEELEPEKSRSIKITRFVDPSVINHQWYDRPYYLGPDDNHGAYFAFVEALARHEKEGVAIWVMRNKRYIGALRALGGYLTMVTLHHANEVISAAELEAPTGRELDDKERDLGEAFIGKLEAHFDPDDYQDEYRDRVMQLIEAKKEGKSLDVEEYEEKVETDSLADALEASLEAA